MPEVKIYDKKVELIDTVDVDFLDIYNDDVSIYYTTIDNKDSIFGVDKYKIEIFDEMKILEVYY